jgi:hypothetical protein
MLGFLTNWGGSTAGGFGAESGRGLRAFTTTVPGAGPGVGAGEVERADGAGLAIFAGDGLGAGEPWVDDDLACRSAGLGVER